RTRLWRVLVDRVAASGRGKPEQPQRASSPSLKLKPPALSSLTQSSHSTHQLERGRRGAERRSDRSFPFPIGVRLVSGPSSAEPGCLSPYCFQDEEGANVGAGRRVLQRLSD